MSGVYLACEVKNPTSSRVTVRPHDRLGFDRVERFGRPARVSRVFRVADRFRCVENLDRGTQVCRRHLDGSRHADEVFRKPS